MLSRRTGRSTTEPPGRGRHHQEGRHHQVAEDLGTGCGAVEPQPPGRVRLAQRDVQTDTGQRHGRAALHRQRQRRCCAAEQAQTGHRPGADARAVAAPAQPAGQQQERHQQADGDDGAEHGHGPHDADQSVDLGGRRTGARSGGPEPAHHAGQHGQARHGVRQTADREQDENGRRSRDHSGPPRTGAGRRRSRLDAGLAVDTEPGDHRLRRLGPAAGPGVVRCDGTGPASIGPAGIGPGSMGISRMGAGSVAPISVQPGAPGPGWIRPGNA